LKRVARRANEKEKDDVILPDCDVQRLLAIADRTITVIHPGPRVLVAKRLDESQDYRPCLTSRQAFDREDDWVLLEYNYYPRLRTITPTEPIDDEPEENIVTGSIDPKSGRIRVVIDCDKRNKIIQPAPFKKWVNWSLQPNYSFPKDLDTIPGWSNEKESDLNAKLKSEGLYVPEAEPIKPKLDDFKDGQKPQKKSYWPAIIEPQITEAHLNYPDSEIDQDLGHALSQQLTFDRLHNESALSDKMSAGPLDLKQSVIKDLYATGALDEFPFKFRATAYLISKGYRNADDAVEIFNRECLGLKQFLPAIAAVFGDIYTIHDFYTHQSLLESIVAKIISQAFSDRKDLHRIAARARNMPQIMGKYLITEVWSRLARVRKELTYNQDELLQILYLAEKPLTYEEASVFLGISFDSVRDREEGLLLKFRKEFPEFIDLEPYKDWTNNQTRFYAYRGLVHLPSMELRRPCYRIKTIDGKDSRECISSGELLPPHDGFSFKKWLEDFRNRFKKKGDFSTEIHVG
jgi:hypothetical protein